MGSLPLQQKQSGRGETQAEGVGKDVDIDDNNVDDYYYKTNPTIFGRILDGTIPSITIKETLTLLAFEDKIPRAPLHALIIPKQYIPSVKSVTSKDIPMLQEMKNLAIEIIQHYYPQTIGTKDYILCYHIPPFNSVDHIHLHVLGPKSQMNFIYKYGKYLTDTCWCISHESLITKLELEKKEREEDNNNAEDL